MPEPTDPGPLVPYPEAAGDALRVPPHNIHAEQSLLGGLMLDNSTWDRIADMVVERDLYRREHRLIFRAVARLAESDQPFDLVTLAETLERTEQLEAAGGLAYLGTLVSETPSAANIKAYAKIVRETSVLRQLIAAGTDIADSAYNPGGRDGAELLDAAERRVFEIAEQEARGGGPGFQPIKTLLTKAVERIDDLYRRDEPITGLATGFTDFDMMTSGLQPSELVIVAGRPSMGKTSFAMNMAEYAAIQGRKPVAVFSMEMPGDALAMRMMASLGRIDSHRVRTGKLEDDEWPRLTSAVNILAGASLFIDDTPALSPTELRARARRLKREQGELGLVVIDYLQLMQVPGSNENRTTEISAISRSLKALAKELGVPVIALSQLNRSLEQRPNKRPVMSDLRECVTGDTAVVLADGRRVPIRALAGGTAEVIAVDARGRLVRAGSDWIWSVGRRPVWRVCLASGRTVRATAEHRLFTGDGWRTLGELTAGDRLARARVLPEAGPAADGRAGRGLPFADTGQGPLDDPDQIDPAAGELIWDPVQAVEPAGVEEVFDLTVPGPANWLADGIISHNSGAIEQDADLIVFIYRDEVYNPESKDKGVAEIIIGKQRNGPIGSVRLAFLGKYTKFENYTDNYYGEEMH